MRKKFLLSSLLLPAIGFAQNLVPNPGFEEYYSCPGYFSQNITEFQAKEWIAAGTGTPDLFNRCSEGEADVPYNWAGVSEPFDGQGFAGIYTWMNTDNHYREYLQCKLMRPLQKDSTYRIQFEYKLSSYSKYSIDRIGLVLTDEAIKISNDQVIAIQPTVSVIQDSALTQETGLWETASTYYKAAGGEQYLTIGNFFNNNDTQFYNIQSRPVQQDMLAGSSYYYIDGVEVISVDLEVPMNEDSIMPSDFYSIETEKLNTAYILVNINFEFNSSRLTPGSFEELNRLAEFLVRNSSLHVELSGHTDDVGSEINNYHLSIDRAVAILEYLVHQGIGRKRMQVTGYGKSRPLLKGVSEEVRKANRRVEAKFIQ